MLYVLISLLVLHQHLCYFVYLCVRTGWLKINYPPYNMQYLRNQWSDFKNSPSCLILTLLWIQRYTTCPLHLNYTTTLPFKTITTKITIFIIMLVLKSNETWTFDISDCHSLLTVQNPAKTVHLKTCSKCQLPAFTQARGLWQSSVWPCWWSSVTDPSHIVCKTFFSSSMVFG